MVVGTPLDFRLGYGVFGGKEGAEPARVVHVADSPGQVVGHATLADSVSGHLAAVLTGLAAALDRTDRRSWKAWVEDLQATVREAAARDAELLDGRGRPDPSGPDLRRAAPPARRRRRRDRRRR